MSWTIFLTPQSEKMLLNIQDKRIRQALKARALRLQENPDQQGKALTRDLDGLRSVRAIGQRYRIVYELVPTDQEVWIVAVGLRKAGDRHDVYEQARRSR